MSTDNTSEFSVIEPVEPVSNQSPLFVVAREERSYVVEFYDSKYNLVTRRPQLTHIGGGANTVARSGLCLASESH